MQGGIPFNELMPTYNMLSPFFSVGSILTADIKNGEVRDKWGSLSSLVVLKYDNTSVAVIDDRIRIGFFAVDQSNSHDPVEKYLTTFWTFEDKLAGIEWG